MATMFSTKGRYALRIMGDLAVHPGWVSLGDVSKRQGISRKYLEQVVSLMHKAGFVESARGKGGGYRLTREPRDYTLGAILRAAEGSLAPVDCLDCTNDRICPMFDTCPTVMMWRDLGKVTASYLDGKTLQDIVDQMHERGTIAAEAAREKELAEKDGASGAGAGASRTSRPVRRGGC